MLEASSVQHSAEVSAPQHDLPPILAIQLREKAWRGTDQQALLSPFFLELLNSDGGRLSGLTLSLGGVKVPVFKPEEFGKRRVPESPALR
jgi:hypothetical protein